MKIALIANGSIKAYNEIKKKLKNYQKIFAVDGGLKHCLAMNISPSLIIGDFDSCPTSLLKKYPHIMKKNYPKDKDFSDLELAVQEALNENASQITIFAGIQGERTDHSLSNLLLLSRYPEILRMENEQESLFMITHSIILSLKENQTLSLIPINHPINNVSTQGLKWELHGQRLDKAFISLSNKTIYTNVRINIDKAVSDGDLLCIIQDL